MCDTIYVSMILPYIRGSIPQKNKPIHCVHTSVYTPGVTHASRPGLYQKNMCVLCVLSLRSLAHFFF